MLVHIYKYFVELFTSCFRQLTMESLGKELDLNGKLVNQEVTILGNKRSADQQFQIQQLRDSLNNIFITFVKVLVDGHNSSALAEDNVMERDFLHGFCLGTRQAPAEKSRELLTIAAKDVPPQKVGMPIVLSSVREFYASSGNINVYHQRGVERGKMAAGKVIEIQKKNQNYFSNNKNKLFTATEISEVIDIKHDNNTISKVIQHLTANIHRRVSKPADQSLLNAKHRLN